MSAGPARQFAVTIDETVEREATVRPRSGTEVEVQLNGSSYVVRMGPRQGALRVGWINGRRIAFAWDRADDEESEGVRIFLGGTGFQVTLLDAMTKQLRELKKASGAASEVKVKAPMPGVVLSVPVEAGQTVREGDVLCILEAMKMQNEIRANRDGVVQSVGVEPGRSVARNDLLVVLAPPATTEAPEASNNGANNNNNSPV